MRNKYILFLVCGLLSFSSCADEEQAGVPEGREISLDFPVAVAAMQAVGGGDAATRAAMSEEEKTIHSLYVVQFNGTATASTVVKAGMATVPDADGKAGYGFTATSGDCRVYVIANAIPSSVTVGATTLGDFEQMMATYTPVASVGAAGLPMCGFYDFNPTTVSTAPAITLKAMVAKLVVRYNLGNSALFKAGTSKITLKNAAAGTTYGTSAASAQGSSTVDNLALGTTYTFYVAENRAGTNTAASTWKQRTLAHIPANSKPLYFEITGKDDQNGSVSIVSLIGDPSKPTEFNINRNTCYTLTATINSFDSDERITVTPDMINLSASATANCYIVTAAGNYGFDGSKPGNNSTISGITKPTNLTTATEARVLWQTGAAVGNENAVVKSVEYDKTNHIVKFTTGGATEGNAVIGIFASNATNAPCLWSWHIWRLNGSAPGTVACTKTLAPTSFNMMDRNLGAYNNTPGAPGSIGLFYQWGRKDPFPGPAGFNQTEPSNIYGSYNKGGTTGSWNGTYSIQTVPYTTGGTEAWAVQYPTAFILYNSSTGDWMSTKNDNLWGTPWTTASNNYNVNQGSKSIYDPCPIGYRVPPQDTWSKQTGNGTFRSNGIVLGSVAANFWFPAAGLRRYNTGAMDYAGYGYYWSSSPNGAGSKYGGYLGFNSSGGVSPRNGNYRAYGFSVRCVSE